MNYKYIAMELHEKIKQLLKIRGENQDALVPILGIGRATVTRKINGKISIFAHELLEILEYFGISLEEFKAADNYTHLLNLHKASILNKPRYVWVPVLNYAQCGNWIDFTDLDYPVGVASRYERAPTNDENAFYIIAKGDSMIGSRIHDGDLLLVEPNKPVENGNIVLANINGEKTVKRFHREEDHVVLQPMNPDFNPIVIADPDKLEKLVVYRITKVTSDL